ncbi:hypothetical protein Y032_0203g1860 [Ancylostoma ceylanicum]|uniref:Uncharacterized protein n=1 Tax=Ancylostoma ceylanicum TaxID=53326 RepID=A0A016SMZ5_9BILA|nr:hypothetical protein Y032_0203g1860 [Ancylostoma ceylanicum]
MRRHITRGHDGQCSCPFRDLCHPRPSTDIEPPPKKGKRDVEKVQVTAVTNQKYNPSLNDEHLLTMRALLNDYCISKNIVYDRDLVQEAVVNVGGKFAVVYTMLDADCDGACETLSISLLFSPSDIHMCCPNCSRPLTQSRQCAQPLEHAWCYAWDRVLNRVHNFAQGAKSQAMFITQIEIKCGAKPEIVIN